MIKNKLIELNNATLLIVDLTDDLQDRCEIKIVGDELEVINKIESDGYRGLCPHRSWEVIGRTFNPSNEFLEKILPETFDKRRYSHWTDILKARDITKENWPNSILLMSKQLKDIDVPRSEDVNDLKLQIYALDQKVLDLETELFISKNKHKQLRDALNISEAWPITDVLLKLIESTEYLLNVKNYDKLGWEEVSHCTKVGREMLTKITEALKTK